MDFEAYKKWSKAQPCVDCGKLKNGAEWWATETQCFECFKKLGSLESRGLPNARKIAEQNGINV